ncbi:type II toxin-antitoxin system RelE/ParE family toxin [Salmonella enterica]|uniref:type II toxin-antitoxin system RelE/ParE family toxin n=1 Tax=Salmonella enterica TaxID=28901 RepID=UPI001F48FED8|nr:type II toxin-antitoxin system RelE/ParE family toxin [Salmonella enterica]
MKLRVARRGQFCIKQRKRFFVYGLAKNDRANISSNEESTFRKAAPYLMSLTNGQISQSVYGGIR